MCSPISRLLEVRIFREPPGPWPLSLAAAVVWPRASSSLAAPSDLPSGAVIAFTPETVCENLPGGLERNTPPPRVG